MVDGTQPLATPPDSVRGHAPCRIDRWSADGWATVRHYADAGLAEHALVEMRRQDPDALLRLVRRADPGPAADARAASIHPIGAAPAIDRDRGRGAPAPRTAPVRVIGALGLIILATLACIAAFSDGGDPAPTPRSAASPAAQNPRAAGVDPSPDADEPGLLAGAWAAAGEACETDAVAFLPGRELRVAAGLPRASAVASYRHSADGTAQVGYPGGGMAVYVLDGVDLRLVRARIADITVTPQRPWRLRRCPDDPVAAAGAPEVPADTVAEAFRLAVRVGDDLAATLALAHGLTASAPLPGGRPPLALAMDYDRPVIVAKLLAAGADPDVRGADGRTPLSRAVIDGRTALVEALLAGGADPRLPDADGLRPLDHATARDDEGLIDILFSAGR